MDRKKNLSKKNQIPMLIVSLALISTSTLIGHGAASEQIGAVVLDYIHNLVCSSLDWWNNLLCFYIASNIFTTQRCKLKRR